MATKIQIRRDTEADWLNNAPTLSQGEVGYILDTKEIVVGDGSSPFSALPRFTATGEIASAWGNLDGGRPNTIYSPNQIVDAGTV